MSSYQESIVMALQWVGVFFIIYYMKIGVFIDIRTALCTRNFIVTVITDHLKMYFILHAFCVNARAVK